MFDHLLACGLEFEVSILPIKRLNEDRSSLRKQRPIRIADSDKSNYLFFISFSSILRFDESTKTGGDKMIQLTRSQRIEIQISLYDFFLVTSFSIQGN